MTSMDQAKCIGDGSMTEIKFFVPGLPQPGGSKKGFYNPKTGRVVVVEDAKKNKPWREDVKGFALDAYSGLPLACPLSLEVMFYLPRPKRHFGSGRNADRLKPSAPPYPTVKPDCTKLLRALEDALTGVLYQDDVLIVSQVVGKRYAEDGRIGASVTLRKAA